MDFSSLYPQLDAWVVNLVNVWPAPIVKPQFQYWEIGHILGLFMLMGSLIMINLRLLGAGLTSEPASVIYRNVKWWLLAGVIMVIGTGILIGMANAERLYHSTAFLIKMISLVAAIIFTYLVTVPVAKADGKVGNLAKGAFAVGLILWAVSIWIFADLKGAIAPGVWHMIAAGALIVTAATSGKLRWVFLGVFAALVIVLQIITHTAFDPVMDAGTDKFNLVNIVISYLCAAWVLGVGLFQIFRSRNQGDASNALAQFTAYSSILVWITVAAAGRWIAFA